MKTSVSHSFLPQQLIKKKRDGGILSYEEIEWFVSEFTKGQLPDYQMSALLMAIFFRGLGDQETLALTKAMLHSGDQMDFSQLPFAKIDKHSTGGIGDKTSLIIGPLVAACGVAVPMISGRGLGHTGGTLDKLESIPGFSVQLPLQIFAELVARLGICFIGQTPEICPADKKLYALRDVTATVENQSLITASILSKKLAEGIDGLVLDVKVGCGAFMKTMEQALSLADSLLRVARGDGKKCVALITQMDQPLGRFAGNAHEVFECLEILKRKTHLNTQGVDLYADTRELSLELSAQMVHLAQPLLNLEDVRNLVRLRLEDGSALKKFEEVCEAQGGRLDQFEASLLGVDVVAQASGHLSGFDLEAIGYLLVKWGAGRSKASDPVDPKVGIEFLVKVGDPVFQGQIVARVFGLQNSLLALDLVPTFQISHHSIRALPLIYKVL